MKRILASLLSLRRRRRRWKAESAIASVEGGYRSRRSGGNAVRRALQRRHVELAHAEHRLHGPASSLRVRIGEELVQPGRRDLPREAVAVLAPAARTLLASVGELLPVVVDLLLAGAVDLQGDGLGEAELVAAVDGDDAMPVELELHGHDHALLARTGSGIPRDG